MRKHSCPTFAQMTGARPRPAGQVRMKVLREVRNGELGRVLASDRCDAILFDVEEIAHPSFRGCHVRRWRNSLDRNVRSIHLSRDAIILFPSFSPRVKSLLLFCPSKHRTKREREEGVTAEG